MNKLKSLTPKEVEKLIDTNSIIIDIRREDEWKHTGVIKNSHTMTFFDMFGNCDITTWMATLEKLISTKDDLIILVCAHANRTRTVADYLIQNHGFTNIAHLEGGIAAWIEEDKDLEKYNN